MRPIYIWWIFWFLACVFSFLGVEIWGLITGKGRTLSQAVWHLEKVVPHQPITQWSAAHVLFTLFWLFIGGVYLWLTGHFIFNIWRS